MKESTEAAVIRIVKEHSGLPELEVTRATRLEYDLGLDSLDGWEILMACEEEFGTEYPEDGFMELKTVGEVIDFCDGKVAA